MKCECDNCGFIDDYDNLPMAEDLCERLTVGCTYTDVECPKCGALCFPLKQPPEEKE